MGANTTGAKALMVTGTIMIIGPLTISWVPVSTLGETVFLVVCGVIPIIGMMLLLAGVLRYLPHRKRIREDGIPMADGRTLLPEELNATITEGRVRDITLLETNAMKWGYKPWKPKVGTYDAWEQALLKRCMKRYEGKESLNVDWFLKHGFRPEVLRTSHGLMPGLIDRERRSREVTGWLIVLVGFVTMFIGGVIISAGSSGGIYILLFGVLALMLGWKILPPLKGDNQPLGPGPSG